VIGKIFFILTKQNKTKQNKTKQSFIVVQFIERNTLLFGDIMPHIGGEVHMPRGFSRKDLLKSLVSHPLSVLLFSCFVISVNLSLSLVLLSII